MTAILRVVRDLRYAGRQLRRTPGFTAITVLTLALGIAASTAVFAVVNAMVFRPTATIDLEHVSRVSLSTRRVGGFFPMPPGTFKPLTTGAFQAFAAAPPDPITAVTGVQWAAVTIRMPGKAERITTEAVAGDYQAVFRAGMSAGRFISADDDVGVALHAVVSERLWREWFGGDPALLGRATVTVDKQPLTVVGVVPRGFRGTVGSADLWLPWTVWRLLPESRMPGEFTGQVYVRSRPHAPGPATDGAARCSSPSRSPPAIRRR